MTALVVNLDDYRRKRPTALPEPTREAAPITATEAIEICLNRPEVLNSWEEGFLFSLRRCRRLSVKQHEVLQRIFDKVSAAAEGWTL
jgi:hypothetical protein